MGNYPSFMLADSPLRYYRLGETSGTTLYDQTGNFQNGTLHGGVTLNQAGLLTADIDPCVSLNGSSGYIDIPTTGLPSGAHAFTLEAWINMPSLPSASFSPIVAIGSGSPSQLACLYYHNPTKSIIFNWFGSDIGRNIAVVVAATTYHVAATYTGSVATLYVNGNQQASQSGLTLNITYGNAYIGFDELIDLDYGNGSVDEVCIYNAALSATQIKNHYLAGIGAINFPAVSVTGAVRDGRVTTTVRDGLSLTTKSRG